VKDVSISDLQKSVDDFLDANAPEYERDDDITVARATAKWSEGQNTKPTHRTTQSKLNQMVKDGKLICVPNVILKNGHIGKVWRIKK
jgi:hypothetical protein